MTLPAFRTLGIISVSRQEAVISTRCCSFIIIILSSDLGHGRLLSKLANFLPRGFFHHIKRLANGHIHVEIAIGAESTDEGDLVFCGGEGFVLFEQRLFLHEADWIVWDVVFPGETLIFFKADAVLMGFPWREVLVLGDAGVRNLGIGIVHHCSALEVTFGANFAKFERAITETPKAISEVTVEWS